MRPTHERMPVILDSSREDMWLDPHANPDRLRSLLVPFASEQMEAVPVHPYVNTARIEGPRCLEPGGA